MAIFRKYTSHNASPWCSMQINRNRDGSYGSICHGGTVVPGEGIAKSVCLGGPGTLIEKPTAQPTALRYAIDLGDDVYHHEMKSSESAVSSKFCTSGVSCVLMAPSPSLPRFKRRYRTIHTTVNSVIGGQRSKPCVADRGDKHHPCAARRSISSATISSGFPLVSGT